MRPQPWCCALLAIEVYGHEGAYFTAFAGGTTFYYQCYSQQRHNYIGPIVARG